MCKTQIQNQFTPVKQKDIFETEDPNILRAFFRDSATAFNAQKKGEIRNKGKINATVSGILFKFLESNKITSHYIKQLSENEILVKRVKIIPIEVIVRNIAAGSLCKRLAIKEGLVLKEPIVEFSYKNDDLNDPLLNDDYIINVLELADIETLFEIKKTSLKINSILKDFFLSIGIKVIDFKLEFGYDKDNNLILADELSPDNFRLWDVKTNEKMDKDRFRQDLGKVEEAYEEVYKRIKEGIKEFKMTTNKKNTYEVKVQVLPKSDILDPQGQTIEKALSSMGYKDIKDMKIGKEIVFKIESVSKDDAKNIASEMCEKLLANPVIEDYNISIV